MFSKLRKRISIYKNENQIVFQPGSRVGIDESLFFTSNKIQYWIFGMVDIDNEVKAIFISVADRTARTLTPIIEKYIRTRDNRKTTVISDGWAAYERLSQKNYKHKIVFHNRGFLLPFPNSTNPVERAWASLKRNLGQYHGRFTEENIQLFVDEAAVRREVEMKKESFYDYILNLLKDNINEIHQ